jgi:hypothetical protein
MINFTEYDRCPGCKKKWINMKKEGSKKFLRIRDGAIICLRCGCLSIPKSWIHAMMAKINSPIILPDDPGAGILKGGK